MAEATQTQLAGKRARIVVHQWSAEEPRFVVLLAHGLSEHARRYDHVADALVGAGAVVYAPDHMGHGLSEGEPSLVDVETHVDDLAAVEAEARAAHAGLPVVVIGHSLGGVIATRLVQRDPSRYAALVLSGPVIGGNPEMLELLALDPIPEIPLDPMALSRDPTVGERYAADKLVYSGPLRRGTLESIKAAVEDIAAGPGFGSLPTLWLHGEKDPLAPYGVTREAMIRLRGENFEEKMYPGAMHEIFNETNRDEVIGDAMAFIEGQVA
jgi:alpha-beta hydrolase superfamily lysophospholipase